MSRKKKAINGEPNDYDVFMWNKIDVMSKLTFDERMKAADAARLLKRHGGEATELAVSGNRTLIIYSIDDMELVANERNKN